MLPFYEYSLVLAAFAFAVLFIYTTSKLWCKCCIYGFQRGIVMLLTTAYILTLSTNVLMISLIVFHEYDNYEVDLEQIEREQVPTIVQSCGLYAILSLNFVLNCGMLCCWMTLFSHLFCVSLRARSVKHLNLAIMITALLYIVMVVVVFVLTEVYAVLSHQLIALILSSIGVLPIVVNMGICLFCLCKLPLSQPIDLDIGLYQRNTFCSCYAPLTRYIWSMAVVALLQLFYLMMNILEIDTWNFNARKEDKYMEVLSSNKAKLIYFGTQFFALLILFNLLSTSIRETIRLNILLDVFAGKYAFVPIEDEPKSTDIVSIHNKKQQDTEAKLHYQQTQSYTLDEADERQQDEQQQEVDEVQPPPAQPVVALQVNSYSNNQEIVPSITAKNDILTTLTDLNNEQQSHEQDEQQDEEEEEEHVQVDEKGVVFTVHHIDPEENFQITQPLGEGAYGPVFSAIDGRDGEAVALKVMSYNPDDCQDLVSEINILRKCRSEFIVNFKDTFYKDTNIWLAMEMMDGSLLDMMKITALCLTEAQCQCVLYQALQGLVYLHSQNLIHRDIKAANILANRSGSCKLADFGIAKVIQTAGAATTIGSPYWMAPEVFGSDKYDSSADLWSLGICAIEMIMGQPPLANYKPLQAMLMIPKNDAPELSEYDIEEKQLSSEFVDFLAKCLRKNPTERWTAEALSAHAWFAGGGRGGEWYKRGLVEFVQSAIPLLEKERALNARVANQELKEEESEEQRYSDEEEEQIVKQQTHNAENMTCIELPVMPKHKGGDDENATMFINMYDDTNEQPEPAKPEEEESSNSDTEIEHGADQRQPVVVQAAATRDEDAASSSSSSDGDNDRQYY